MKYPKIHPLASSLPAARSAGFFYMAGTAISPGRRSTGPSNEASAQCWSTAVMRYHATAVESGGHLTRCMVYIDTNMVRAGVVSHPAMWPFLRLQ